MSDAFNLIQKLLLAIDLCAKACRFCNSISTRRDKDDIRRLGREVAQLRASLSCALKVAKNSDDKLPEHLTRLRETVEDCQLQLNNLNRKLGPHSRRAATWALAWPLKERDIDSAASSLAGCRSIISLALQTETATLTREIHLANKLRVAEGASFDSHANEHNTGCHRDTQCEFLADVYEWTQDLQGKTVLWLNGMAGTGKSTVSISLARRLCADGILGASFFFKGGQKDRGSAALLFTTIATQLINRLPALKPHVWDAVDQDPSIAEKTLGDQFEKLILGPVSQIFHGDDATKNMIVVIDGLDECDGEKNIRTIIKLLPRAKTLKAIRLKFIVTSRPVIPALTGFGDIPNDYNCFKLHDRPPDLIKHDISVFIRDELKSIRDDYNATVSFSRNLPIGWPREEDIEKLVTMANPFFLFAATICRFLRDRSTGDPTIHLANVLSYQTKSYDAKLRATYLPILKQLFHGVVPEGKELGINKFKTIIGSIVSLANPLSADSLSRLLDIPKHEVDAKVDCLLSVLMISPDSDAVLQVLHESFREFLMSPSAADTPDQRAFYINEEETHMNLTKRCLETLSKSARDCGHSAATTGFSHPINDKQRTHEPISPEIKYASCYWVFHLKKSTASVQDGDVTHKFLQRHFLYWLSLLSRVGRLSESIDLIDDLQGLSLPPHISLVGNFLYDAKRFLLSYLPVMKTSPSQIYMSAILFAPKQSVIRKTFERYIPRDVALLRADPSWGPCLKTLEGHKDVVNCVALSHDGALIASASSDNTIRLWDSVNGVHRQTLEGHSGFVNSVAFSTSDALLVSTSNDMTIAVWRVGTSERCRVLCGHESRTSFAAFSYCEAFIASASGDSCVKIWEVGTGACLRTINSGSPLSSVAWAKDDSFVISSGYNGDINAWHVGDGSCLQTYKGHHCAVRFATISGDGKHIASASLDKSIKLWDIQSGACLRTLHGHNNWVNGVSFSHDGKHIASASMDQTVRIWSTDTGRCVQTLKGHNGVINSVEFCHNSPWLASCSSDRTTKIWEYKERTHERTPDNHADYVNCLVFSPDGALLISASDDCAIKVWNTADGKCLKTLRKHKKRVQCLEFSPSGRHFASASDDETVGIWHVAGGPSCFKLLKGHKDAVKLLKFSQDNRLLVSASNDLILLWNCQSWVHWKRIEVPGGKTIRSIAISRCSTQIAAALGDKTIGVWGVESTAHLQTLQNSCLVNSVAFSANRVFLLSSSGDGALTTWDIRTSDIKAKAQVGANLNYMSFNAEGSRLHTEIGAIRWDTTTSSVASPNNDPVFEGFALSNDKIWITRDGVNFLWLPPQYRPWRSAIMGSKLAIGCSDGRVMIIHLSKPFKYLKYAPELQFEPNKIKKLGFLEEHDRTTYHDAEKWTGLFEPSAKSIIFLAVMFLIGILSIVSGMMGAPGANMYVGISLVGFSVVGCVYLGYQCLVRSR